MYTRIQEIDALKQNAISLIAIADREAHGLGSEEALHFLATLDGLLESPNLRVRQIPELGHLFEYAFLAGMRWR